jgi:hypothetical protein
MSISALPLLMLLWLWDTRAGQWVRRGDADGIRDDGNRKSHEQQDDDGTAERRLWERVCMRDRVKAKEKLMHHAIHSFPNVVPDVGHSFSCKKLILTRLSVCV